MRRYLGCTLLILLVFINVSCGEGSDVPATTDPSNLQVQVTNPADGTGNITIQAMADNAVNYEFDPGDDSEIKSNATGNFTHTYELSGSYTAVIKAFGESGRFILDESLIAISIDNEEIPQYDGFSLIWQEEFNAASINTSIWNFETGGGGWGNNELQYYRSENTEVTGGNLVITAREENFGGRSYTSSRLTTENKFDFQYGRVDVRAKLPEGQGLWPALWMLGSNFRSAGWPACGEIDIMEMIGGNGRENTVHGTLHWQDPNGDPNNNNRATFGESYTQSSSFSDDFHVFSIVWKESTIEWLVDNNSFHVQSISDPNKSEFQNSFFFIVNVAVGGNWPGSPNASTEFPQQMMVDYIRVYQEQ